MCAVLKVICCSHRLDKARNAVIPTGYPRGMDRKIWTAPELEKMTPAERHKISQASIVRDLDDAPQHLADEARRFVEARIAAEESSPAS